MVDEVFGDFEKDYAGSEKAAAFSFAKIPPGTYRVVATSVDLGDGELRDFEIVDNRPKNGSLGVKLFLEILAPETMTVQRGNETVEVKTKGEIHEAIFWITQKNMPYVKRDLATILGRDLASLGEIRTTQWAGHTCEIVLKHEEYQGRLSEKVAFYNPWTPEQEAPPEASAAAKTEKAPAAAGAKKPATASATKSTAAPPAGGAKRQVSF